jgi:hypothetical protein
MNGGALGCAMVDRRRVARWLPILLGACGGPHHETTTAPGANAAAQDAGVAVAADARTVDAPRLMCWLVADPRCKDRSLPRIC